MAIFHFSAKPISRSQGRSATAAAAYRAAVEIVDERTGLVHDYTRKGGVLHSQLILPGGGTADRAAFWNGIEAHHKRGDAVLVREVEVSLPTELSAGQRQALAVGFARELAERYGVAADVALHAPRTVTDRDLEKNPDQHHETDPDGRRHNGNWHAHIMLSACHVQPDGALGKKAVELDPIHCQRAKIENMADRERARWGELVNAALAAHGHEARVDHRSHEARGLEDLPTIKVGKWSGSAERQAHNAEVRALNHDLAQALAERAAAAAAEKVAAADQAARDRAERLTAWFRDRPAGQAQAEADDLADERALADYQAAVEHRAGVERYASQVQAWRSQAEDRLRVLSVQAASLPTASERKRARAQLQTARRSNDQAQRKLEKAQRAARSRRWWNPISVYRALVASRELPGIEHRAGALAHALALIDAAARSERTREDAQQLIEQLRQQLQDNPVPVVPALPAPPVLRGREAGQQVEVDPPPQDETQAYDRPDRPRGLH